MAKIAQWSLNEASGTRVDAINGYNLTPIGSVAAVPGLFGNAVNVPASSRLDAGDVAALEFATGAYTHSAWVKTGAAGSQILTNKYDFSTNAREWMWRVNAGVLQAYISSNGTIQEELAGGISGLNDGLWHNLVWTRSNLTHKFYVDGALTHTATATIGTIHTGSSPFILGAYIDNTQPWADGAIDNVEIWDEALGPTAISDMYYTALPPTSTLSLTNQSPAPSDTGVLVNADVELTIADSANNVVLTTVEISVGGNLAYDGDAGGFQTGYTGTATSDGSGGYDFVINPTNRFAYDTLTEVEVYAENDVADVLDETYDFTTEVDSYVPEIYYQTPAPSQTLVNTITSIVFRVKDASDINFSTMLIDIDFGDGGGFYRAYDGPRGGFNPDYDGIISVISDPLDYIYNFNIVTEKVFNENSTCQVRIYVEDLAPTPNVRDYTYGWSSAIMPKVTTQTPAPDSVGIPRWYDVEFTLDGGSGTVTLATVIAKIDDNVAYASSSFQTGYTGTVVANGSGYDFVINPIDSLPESSGIVMEITGTNSLGHELI